MSDITIKKFFSFSAITDIFIFFVALSFLAGFFDRIVQIDRQLVTPLVAMIGVFVYALWFMHTKGKKTVVYSATLLLSSAFIVMGSVSEFRGDFFELGYLNLTIPFAILTSIFISLLIWKIKTYGSSMEWMESFSRSLFFFFIIYLVMQIVMVLLQLVEIAPYVLTIGYIVFLYRLLKSKNVKQVF